MTPARHRSTIAAVRFRSSKTTEAVLAVAAVMSTAVFGCRAGAPRQTLDLVDELPAAEVRREVSEIDIGTHEARPHLGAGWSMDETRSDGTTEVWATGRRSVVRFFLSRPMKLVIEFTCRPFRFPGSPVQRAALVFNGGPIATVELSAGQHSYTVPVDAAQTIGGINTVEFKWSHAASPSDVQGARDTRRLAARFDRIRLIGVTDSAPPFADTESGSVTLPTGSELAFYVAEGAAPVLELGPVEGDDGSRLEVWWEADDAASRLLASLSPADRARTVHVPAADRSPVRISLRSVGEAGAVSVSRPALSWADPPVEPPESRPPDRSGSRPNIVLYLVDTLRPDRLGCYGNPNGLSPHLDRLARNGVVFRRAIAQSSWTKPSVVSILTGMGPMQHGVNGRRSVLADDATTMAESLAAGGYQTAGFASNAYLTEQAGFAQGFESYLFRFARSGEITDEVISWLDRRDDERPFFLYVHTIDPHAPYEPSRPFREKFAAQVDDLETGTVDHIRAIAARTVDVSSETVADLLSLYDAEVAENDESFGRLIDALDQREVLATTLVVFVSDHGEEFQEHGVLGHGWDLHGEVLTVPLVVRAPGGVEGLRIDHLVQHVDVLPTILDFAGLAAPTDHDGRSLRAEIVGSRPSRSGVLATSYMAYEGREGIAVEVDGWKVIEPLSQNFLSGRVLYDTSSDAAESVNKAEDRAVLAGFLASIARRELRRMPHAADESVLEEDGETTRALEALGYIR